MATTDVEIRVAEDPAREAAAILASVSGHLALSGGGTVGRAYELAAELRPDWSGLDVWFGDDRAVPPNDERSNHRLVRAALLDRLSRLPEVHRVRGELGAEAAAARYDDELEGITLDLALNGIGPDGHTASLFPGAPGLDERARRAIAAEAGLEPFVPRVTMTPPMFADAALLVYLVTGAGKAEAVRRAFAADPSPDVPASLIRGRETLALLDPEAAASL
ncbi:MAG TPA: 6-phosphogluconolactonase [Gaiellaceae bacterium]|nr:6-phosphogluconolactonase [Gaiellaceae bacterium]